MNILAFISYYGQYLQITKMPLLKKNIINGNPCHFILFLKFFLPFSYFDEKLCVILEFLIKQEEQLYITCQIPGIVKYFLMECKAFALIRKDFVNTNNMKYLFENVNRQR